MEQKRIDGATRAAAMQVQAGIGGGVYVNGLGAGLRPGTNHSKKLNEIKIINILCNLYGERVIRAKWASLQSIVESGDSPGRALPAAIRVMGGGVIC